MNKKQVPWVVFLTIFNIVLSLLIGFALMNKQTMEAWYQQLTFYFILIAFGLWLIRILPENFNKYKATEFLKKHCLAIIIAAVLVILSVFASKPDFRILADETNLLGMSMAMYDNHECHNPTQVLIKYHGIKRTLGKVTDMRPGFFPFLIYIAHSIFGYSSQNGFIVNAISGFLCLLCLYWIIFRWFGRFWGITGILLLASYPLFILYLTSCGFEITNLLFALISFILLDNFLRDKSAVNAERLFLIMPLLAQTRYESVLAVFCFTPLVLVKLPKKQYFQLTLMTALTPLLFIPIAWLRLVTYSTKAFQVSDMSQAFSLKLFARNIGKAVTFFTGHSKNYGIVPIITLLAIVGILWLIVDAFCKKADTENDREADGKETYKPHALIFAGFLFILTHACARFFYFWGNLTLQYTSRLGIIFLPFLVILAIYALRKAVKLEFLDRKWVIIGACLLITHNWPVAGQNLAVREIFFYREFKSVRQYLELHQPNKDRYILVSNLSNLYVPLRYSAISCQTLNSRKTEMLKNLQTKLYKKIIIVQKINILKKQPAKGSIISKQFNLKTLHETQLSHDHFIRISEISE